MTDERRAELIAAVGTVLESEELFSEFENANYHSAWEFIRETYNELVSDDAIGDERWVIEDE